MLLLPSNYRKENMGAEILERRKPERRFLGCSTVDRSTAVDDDDGIADFSLEGFHEELDQQLQDSTSDDDDAGDEANMTTEERRIYWESQHFLLQEILEQYESIGSKKLREEMKRQIEIARDRGVCDCERRCSTLCLRRGAVNQLCSKGLNAALCVSHWKATHNTPAGWHEYIEVLVNTQGKKKQIPFVVEVGFRDEFRMAKCSEEYKKLIEQLPEMYIGKWEHMKAIIRLVCEAAKKSAEEQKIHMGPWRKKNFMQMKWSPAFTKNYDTSRFIISRCLSSRAGAGTAGSSPNQQERLPTTLKVA